MANPIFLLYRKLVRQYPWLQSQGNRVLLVLAIITVSAIILAAIGSYRENTAIADCKTRGGTPIFAKRNMEIPDGQGSAIKQQYMVFDRCHFKTESTHPAENRRP
jgi:hypothetical protein